MATVSILETVQIEGSRHLNEFDSGNVALERGKSKLVPFPYEEAIEATSLLKKDLLITQLIK